MLLKGAVLGGVDHEFAIKMAGCGGCEMVGANGGLEQRNPSLVNDR